MGHEDQTISCSECGENFVFTQGERQFYIERGFEYPPKRCKPCRAQRKQQSGRNREAVASSSGNDRERSQGGQRSRESHPHSKRSRENPQRTQQTREAPQRSQQGREVHVTTCQACGVTTKVPFKPQEGRGVYCPECYHALKALNRATPEDNHS